MKILAIDTSGQTASAALIEDEKLIGEFTQNDKLTHSPVSYTHLRAHET